ncbi:hypothetical protein, partial [Pseudoalteromonas marina]
QIHTEYCQRDTKEYNSINWMGYIKRPTHIKMLRIPTLQKKLNKTILKYKTNQKEHLLKKNKTKQAQSLKIQFNP